MKYDEASVVCYRSKCSTISSFPNKVKSGINSKHLTKKICTFQVANEE